MIMICTNDTVLNKVPAFIMLDHGSRIISPGGGFTYTVQGPVCVLFDREELPWPCCSIIWKGKQPSWRRIGSRFIPDIAARRCPSYYVKGVDIWGIEWEQVLTIYHQKLSKGEQDWWYWKHVAGQEPPDYVTL